MINENQLVHKTFYETFLTNTNQTLPAQVLGQVYFEEQNKEDSFDLSYIRFAQGELYFQYQDFEAAIFKWENIKNELEPWAIKNIGDAYYELGILSTAEDKYTSIEVEDRTLNVEVSLRLFSLYTERNKLDDAYKTISNAIHINPDYPLVTKIAREFYEENNDYEQAVKLAVKESIRTEREEWFLILITYVKEGYTCQFPPEFFAESLLTLYEVSKPEFTQFIEALWISYKNKESYLPWLRTVNDLFFSVDVESDDHWEQTVEIFERSFFELTNGSYYLNELHDVVPNLLANWLKLSSLDDGLLPSATVLAWNEIFPGTVLPDAIYKAESIIFDAENGQGGLETALQLFNTISGWAGNHSIEVGYKVKWWLDELTNPQIQNHFLLAGKSGSGKTTFIHSLLGDQIFKGTTSDFVILHDDDEIVMNQITNSGQQSIKSHRELVEAMQDDNINLYQVNRPCILLHEQKCAVIDTPPINGNEEKRNELFDALLLADGLLYILDGATPFTENEYDALCQIKKFSPDLKVHFILNKVDLVASDADTEERTSEIKSQISAIFSDAEILPYSSLHPFSQQYNKLNSYLSTQFPYNMKEKQDKRTAKVLTLIRKMLTSLLQKRVEMEKGLVDSIQWNEELLGRLNGFKHKLSDLNQEKAVAILTAYRQLIKESKEELKLTIPKLIKESSELIKEDSDFKQIHILLNESMNVKVQEYIEQNLLPTVCDRLENWILLSNDELLDSQSYLLEMKDSFNEIYQREKLFLNCEFTILEDWRRDIQRMTGRIHYEKENIMLKNKPAQLLLKSAGKLFGAVNQNKQMLVNQYKKYIDNESYNEVTSSISTKLFLPFELFEKGIKQDISSFFNDPILEVNHTIHETETIIENEKQGLSDMKASPEVFYDPLKLFEVNLLQQEFILQAKKEYSRSR